MTYYDGFCDVGNTLKVLKVLELIIFRTA